MNDATQYGPSTNDAFLDLRFCPTNRNQIPEEGKRAQEERLVIRKALKARDDGYAVVIHAEQTEELDLILVDVLHLRFKHSWEGRWKRLYILQISKTPEK